jgi:hypothetical protein
MQRRRHRWGLFPPSQCICLCHLRDSDGRLVRSDRSCQSCYEDAGGNP